MRTVHKETKNEVIWPTNENDTYTTSRENLQAKGTDQEKDPGKYGQMELQKR